MAGRKLAAELVGTLVLLTAVVGSGIMAERLSGGNDGVALLANSIATGAILFVLITMLGPVSGAHFNPAVTLVMVLRGDLSWRDGGGYLAAQVAGGLLGVFLAHAMFDVAILQASAKVRTGSGQWIAEATATAGLVMTILLTLRARAEAIATSVALYITSAYWFTASTSFANPAVTLARSFTDSFAGINLADAPAFVLAQVVGALTGWGAAHVLVREAVAEETDT
ncbi:MAG: aquaporin [Hyphomicrobiaceae bacterium]